MDNLLALLGVFMASWSPTAMEWMTLLGHMALLIHLVPGAHLRMRSLQLNLHSHWSSTTRVVWTPDLLQDLELWAQEHYLLADQALREGSPDFL